MKGNQDKQGKKVKCICIFKNKLIINIYLLLKNIFILNRTIKLFY